MGKMGPNLGSSLLPVGRLCTRNIVQSIKIFFSALLPPTSLALFLTPTLYYYTYYTNITQLVLCDWQCSGVKLKLFIHHINALKKTTASLWKPVQLCYKFLVNDGLVKFEILIWSTNLQQIWHPASSGSVHLSPEVLVTCLAWLLQGNPVEKA